MTSTSKQSSLVKHPCITPCTSLPTFVENKPASYKQFDRLGSPNAVMILQQQITSIYMFADERKKYVSM